MCGKKGSVSGYFQNYIYDSPVTRVGAGPVVICHGYIRVNLFVRRGKLFGGTYALVFEFTHIYPNIYPNILNMSRNAQKYPRYAQICTQTLTYAICHEIGFVAIYALLSGTIFLYLTNNNSGGRDQTLAK